MPVKLKPRSLITTSAQARELFAAFAAAEADKLIETKGALLVARGIFPGALGTDE